MGPAQNLGKEIMKMTVCAAISVFTLGIGSAYAGDGDGYSATTLFTSIQNEQAAHARAVPVRNAGAEAQAYDAHPQDKSTWLFRVFSSP
jgi:hypothetical protein